MTQDQTITLYKWILKEFTVKGRAASVAKSGPELASPKGRFAIQYTDGVLHLQEEKQEGVQQEEPQRITWRFKEYVPEKGAYVIVYKNESTGEEYEYTNHVYSIQQSEKSTLDVFLKRPHP